MAKRNIPVFEQCYLYCERGETPLTKDEFKSLVRFYGNGTKCPYYTLGHGSVKFNKYVGVLQVGNLTIEVLPKADRNSGDEASWRTHLLNMLKRSGIFPVKAPTFSSLNVHNNSILDLYIELFIQETETLLHAGLVKHYHKTEGNRNSLKGSLVFGKHIQQNLVHQERFYVRHTTYDREHPLNRVLYKTVRLLKIINSNSFLTGRIGVLLLNFPELPDIQVSEVFFDKLEYNRKTECYKTAIEIARLLLLNYHPDVNRGSNNVFALMFDMNLLWERYVYKMVQREIGKHPDCTLEPQVRKYFWGSNYLKPDLVITRKTPEKDEKGEYIVETIVIDTKWKLSDGGASVADLRQMFAYNKFWRAKKSILLFPGDPKDSRPFQDFLDTNDHACRVAFVSVVDGTILNDNIGADVMGLLDEIRLYS